MFNLQKSPELPSPASIATPLQHRTSIWSAQSDFWNLGGASILVCLLLHIASQFRNVNPIQAHFMQIGALFSALTIFGNDPHFMISYRFGYGRGLKFILAHWFSLVVVPLGLIAVYAVAFFHFDSAIPNLAITDSVNHLFENLGMAFRIGKASSLGDEIIGQSIWLMYLTVGWHYCKQVYGCMMVYAHYHSYRLQNWQKQVFKWSAIWVGIYQFTYVTELTDQMSSGQGGSDSRFPGIHLSAVGLPMWMRTGAASIMGLLAVVCIGILIHKYRQTKQAPPINFLVPWLALYVWWIPFGQLPEFYFIMVPFFHSLQYLPFAFRMENEKIKKDKWYNTNVALRILMLLFVGVLAFELAPNFLDGVLRTDLNQTTWFFATTVVVFINIHHFFIDHVVWRFKDPAMREALLYQKE